MPSEFDIWLRAKAKDDLDLFQFYRYHTSQTESVFWSPIAGRIAPGFSGTSIPNPGKRVDDSDNRMAAADRQIQYVLEI
jgi:hypothetical protein